MNADAVERIKERLSILDVVSPYVELHKAGKSYKGKSPFTNERTPSFHVSPDRGMYYCFSSSQGGDMFTFIEKMEGVDFKGALKILAEKAGVELVAEDPQKRNERDTQYALIEEATKFFFETREQHAEATTYVTDRGVEMKTIHAWRIGFAPDAWRALKEHLTGKGFAQSAILKAGLSKQSEGAKEPYDVFRNRIMFPIMDSSGRVVAFSGRTLSKDPDTPKYVNSPETDLFQKSDILFGYDKAKQGIRHYDFSLIVEGQFDVVLAHQAGYTNTVAVSGTALTPHHVDLLGRLSNRVVLALDADRAGIAAVKRGAELMLKRNMDVKVVRILGGKDPADIIREDPKEFRKMVGTAVHVIEFLLTILKEGAKDERTYKLRVREELAPLLATMPNRIDREHFEGVIAEALGTSSDAIHYEVERVVEKWRTEARTEPQPSHEATLAAADPGEMVTLHEQGAARTAAVRSYLAAVASFLTDANQRALDKALGEVAGTNVQALVAELDPDAYSRLTFTLESQLADMQEKHICEEVVDKLNELAQLIAKQSLRAARADLAREEQAGNAAGVEAALARITALQAALRDPIRYTLDIFTIAPRKPLKAQNKAAG